MLKLSLVTVIIIAMLKVIKFRDNLEWLLVLIRKHDVYHLKAIDLTNQTN